MNIKTYWLWEMPEKLEGTVFIIDAFCATTNITLFLAKSVRRLIIANDQTAVETKNKYPNAFLIGESTTLERNQFSLGNSPKKIVKEDLTAKDIIYMSINGTKAIEKSLQKGAKNVYTLCYLNFDTVIQHAKTVNEEITIIMSGDEGTKTTEDIFCAESFIKAYNKETIDRDTIKREVAEFIKSFYGVPRSDDTTKLVLSWNKYPVLPYCFINNKGFIEITNKI